MMIYLVEDDDNIRKLVSYALKKEGYEVNDFSIPSLFLSELNKKIPDLVLLDIMLPEEDGLSILKKLQNNLKYKNIPIIMLTAKGTEFDKVTGLDMGADDYITKPFGMTELISRVNAVIRRYNKTKIDNEYHIKNLYVNIDKHIIKVDDEDIELSYKEFQLLKILLEAKSKVVDRDNLINAVWGDFYEDSRTLDVHIRKLRVKLKNAGEYIKTIKNIGYKLDGENDN